MENKSNLIDPWRLALRYNNSPLMRKLYDGLGTIFDNSSMWDFYKFFNTDEARGTWLDKIGNLYGIPRPLGVPGDQFVLDVDMLDDDTVVLDGSVGQLLDVYYRRLLQIKAFTNLTLPSVNTIAQIFDEVFAFPDTVITKVIDGYMRFDIEVYFGKPSNVKILQTILDNDPHFLGEFPGVDYSVKSFILENP